MFGRRDSLPWPIITCSSQPLPTDTQSQALQTQILNSKPPNSYSFPVIGRLSVSLSLAEWDGLWIAIQASKDSGPLRYTKLHFPLPVIKREHIPPWKQNSQKRTYKNTSLFSRNSSPNITWQSPNTESNMTTKYVNYRCTCIATDIPNHEAVPSSVKKDQIKYFNQRGTVHVLSSSWQANRRCSSATSNIINFVSATSWHVYVSFKIPFTVIRIKLNICCVSQPLPFCNKDA